VARRIWYCRRDRLCDFESHSAGSDGPVHAQLGQTLGKAALLGWYSEKGGQIGDIPMTLSGGDLSLIMQEVKTADGSQSPVQFMWSNAAAGPEGPIDATH
jgi:hypothetical protein